MARLRLTLALLLAAAGCQAFPTATPCMNEIPPGGCPVGRGGTCADPTCTALYECLGGEWVRSQTCPMHDGGAGGFGGASGAGGEGVGDAGVGGDASVGDACTPVDIDAGGMGMDCTPELELPDCPVAAALGCAQSACLTGCTDFFVCKPTSMGPQWVDVAYCTGEGQLVIAP